MMTWGYTSPQLRVIAMFDLVGLTAGEADRFLRARYNTTRVERLSEGQCAEVIGDLRDRKKAML